MVGTRRASAGSDMVSYRGERTWRTRTDQPGANTGWGQSGGTASNGRKSK